MVYVRRIQSKAVVNALLIIMFEAVYAWLVINFSLKQEEFLFISHTYLVIYII